MQLLRSFFGRLLPVRNHISVVRLSGVIQSGPGQGSFAKQGPLNLERYGATLDRAFKTPVCWLCWSRRTHSLYALSALRSLACAYGGRFFRELPWRFPALRASVASSTAASLQYIVSLQH